MAYPWDNNEDEPAFGQGAPPPQANERDRLISERLARSPFRSLYEETDASAPLIPARTPAPAPAPASPQAEEGFWSSLGDISPRDLPLAALAGTADMVRAFTNLGATTGAMIGPGAGLSDEQNQRLFESQVALQSPEGRRGTDKELGKVAAGIRSAQSPEFQAQSRKQYLEGFDSSKKWYDPAKYKDVRFADATAATILGSAAESAPSIVGGIGTGALVTTGIRKAAEPLIKRSVPGSVLEGEAAKAATKMAAIDFAINAAGYGIGEGAVAAAAMRQQTFDTVSQLPIETLRASPRFMEIYDAAKELDEAQRFEYARETLASELGNSSALQVFAATFLTGGAGAGLVGKIASRMGGRSASSQLGREVAAEGRGLSALKGAGGEAGQELIQSGGEGFIGARAQQQAGMAVDPIAEAANQAVGGAAAGGILGGGLGAAFPQQGSPASTTSPTGQGPGNAPASPPPPPLGGAGAPPGPTSSAPAAPAAPPEAPERPPGRATAAEVSSLIRQAKLAGVPAETTQAIAQAVVNGEATNAQAAEALRLALVEMVQPDTTPAVPETVRKMGATIEPAAAGAPVSGKPTAATPPGDTQSPTESAPLAAPGAPTASPTAAPTKDQLDAARAGSDQGESEAEWRANYDRVVTAPDLAAISTVDLERADNFAASNLASQRRKGWDGGTASTPLIEGFERERLFLRSELAKRRASAPDAEAAELEALGRKTRLEMEAALGKPGKAQPAPAAQGSQYPDLSSALKQLDDPEDGQGITSQQLLGEVDNLIQAGRAPASLVGPAGDYRKALRADFEQDGGRGETEPQEEAFLGAVRSALAAPSAAPTQTAAGTDRPIVGGKVKTATGRDIPAPPAISTKSNQAATAGLKKQHAYLLEQGRAEAASRNDDFATTQFAGLDPKKPSREDVSALNEYLFGDPDPTFTETKADGKVKKDIVRGKRKTKPPDETKDTLIQYLAKHERGIDSEEAEKQGLDPAQFKRAEARSGIARAFRKGGMTFDEAAELLAEKGYPVFDEDGNYNPNDLLNILDRSLRGNKVFSSQNLTWMDEKAAADAETEALEAEFRAAARKEREKLVDDRGRKMTSAWKMAKDRHPERAAEIDAAVDDRWTNDDPETLENVYAYLQEFLADVSEATAETGSEVGADPAENAGAQGNGDARSVPRQPEGEAPPPLELEASSPEADAAAKARVKAAADAKAQAEAKAQSELDAGSFDLAGSDRSSDANPGQADPFRNDDGSQPQPQPQPSAGAPTVSANKIFTAEAAEKARAVLRAKLRGQLNVGLDPEVLAAGLELSGYHIEKGARTFAAYARAMLEDMGEMVRPYLKQWYMAVKYDPRSAELEGMASATDIDSANVDTILATKASPDVLSPEQNPEPDSGDAAAAPPVGAQPVRNGRRGEGRGAREAGGQSGGNGRPAARGDELPGDSAAAGGKRGDQPIHTDGRGFGVAVGAAGDPDGGGSADGGGTGTPDDVGRKAEAVVDAARAAARLSAKEKLQLQAAAGSIPVKYADADSIAATLPFLFEFQHEDVLKAEIRFQQPTSYGMLFANGTGTGKTYVGLGIIKRLAMQGKGNGLLVVPSQKIVGDWIKAAKNLGLDIRALDSTTDPGKGIAITTYANLGDNLTLADREYDFILADEAHTLMQSGDAKSTAALRAVQALTLHPDGYTTRARMIHRVASDKSTALAQEIREIEKKRRPVPPALQARRLEADLAFDALRAQVQADVRSRQGAARPRAVFLSATPFAYEPNVQWASGFLFEYPKVEREGYNSPGPYEAFMIQHFGYRMRTGKLTQPGPEVDSGLMQRQFNTWMRRGGVIASRMMDSDFDYDRKFVLIDPEVGTKIDEGLAYLQTHQNGMYRPVYDLIAKKFDFLARSRLLEALKARESIAYIKAQHALGRKVVVFYDYNEGGGFNIFDIQAPEQVASSISPAPVPIFDIQAPEQGADAETVVSVRGLVNSFRAARPDLVELNTMAPSPLQTLTAEFPQAAQYNGLTSTKKRTEGVDAFNNDDLPGSNLVLAQKAANAGWSAHDTSGKHQRVLINLGLPTAPTVAIQQEGRIYRVGQASDAVFRYFNTGTSWERTAFASTIARRAATAENLAMGEQARGLKDAFIEAFEAADADVPAIGDGKGGKLRDRALVQALSDFERAVTFYFGQAKKNSRTRSQEGADYFATPEPLGLKMVEWALVRPGEDMLEPSAGHGAIARWFPENNKRTVIEPSAELASRLALLTDAKLVNETFETHHVVNKYDTIVMNPPFGVGGKTAIEHLEKAVTHLREGGRIVAIIPTGPAADKRFDAWLYGKDEDSKGAEGVYLTADFKLPQATFERASTSVATRVVVIDKVSKPDLAPSPISRDYSDAANIKAFFSRIENTDAPNRVVLPATAPAPAPVDTSEDAPGSRAVTMDFTTSDSKHTMTRVLVFYAHPKQRVERSEYDRRNAVAKKHGGYWSSYQGRGANPGFIFKSAAARAAFLVESTPEAPVVVREEEETTYDRGNPAKPMFYSAVLRAAENAKQAKAGALQWLATIRNAQGVKQEELDWIGLGEWLGRQEGSVTREAVIDFIRANQVTVTETVLGTPTDGDPNKPKYVKYAFPGGSGYRELLLTLPSDVAPEDRGTAYARDNSGDFQSAHWEVPNILASVRFDERRDIDGKRVLFIEEIQSDWHQKGRRDGHKLTGEALKAEEARTGGIANAPFKTTWPELAMKRMIRWATEQGFERVAWTTGEQLASRLMASQPSKKAKTGGEESLRSISGVQLNIGGNGMNVFYDKILVDAANRLGKKWGAKAGEVMVDLGAAKFDREGETYVEAFTEVHSIDVTPQMRAASLNGVALFEPRRGYRKPGGGSSAQIGFDFSALPTRPNTTPAQGAIARELLSSLVTRRDQLAGVSVIADGIPKTFQESGGYTLIGKTVANVHDLAVLGQAYRDPRFETFRFFAVKNGVIVHHTGLSNRAPGFVSFPIESRLAIYDILKGLDADGWYAFHNHPSGNPNASSSDVNATITMVSESAARGLAPFLGHVIVDTDKFTEINRRGQSRKFDLGVAQTYTVGQNPRMDHQLLTEKINKPSDLVRLANALGKADTNQVVTIIATSSRNEVRGIADFPVAMLFKETGGTDREKQKRDPYLRGVVRLREFARQSGGARLFAIHPDRSLLTPLVRAGLLQDAIAPMPPTQTYQQARDFGRATGQFGENRPKSMVPTFVGEVALNDFDMAIVESVRTEIDATKQSVLLESMSIAGTVGMDSGTGQVTPAILDRLEPAPDEQGELDDAIAESSFPPDIVSVQSPISPYRQAPVPQNIRDLRRRIFASDARAALPWKDRVRAVLDRFRQRARLAWRQYWIDKFNAFANYERLINAGELFDASQSGYKQAIATQNLQGVMRSIMHEGIPEWRGGAYVPARDGRKGILSIFAPLVNAPEGNLLPLWEVFAVAVRSSRLITETNPDGTSRENLLTAQDIADGLSLEQAYPMFRQVFDDWQAFNKQTLNMAMDAGLIDPEARAVWERNDYLPFYRAVESMSGKVSAVSLNKAIANQRAKIMRLRGGTAQLEDVFENLMMNTAHLVDASFKNRAAQALVEQFDGVATKRIPWDTKAIEINTADIDRALRAAGLAVQAMIPGASLDYWATFFRPQRPAGPNIVTVMFGGKPQFYEVDDPLMLQSFVEMNPNATIRQLDIQTFGLLSGAKSVLTRAVTILPGFQVSNWLKDTPTAWVQNNDGLVPIVDSVKGFVQYLSDEPVVRDLMMMGAFSDGFYDTKRGALKKHLLSKMREQDANNLLNSIISPKTLWSKYHDIQQAAEHASRLAVFNAAIKAGRSSAEAAYQAHDLINFQSHGAGLWAQLLTMNVPFLNARLQGLDRLLRGYKENRLNFMLKGSTLTMMTILLAAMQDDDDRYQDLPEWERDVYWHIFVGDKHFRLPKPFEVGALFATIPERAFRAIRGTDTGRATLQSMGRMVFDTFSFNPTPQVIRPLLEQVTNFNFFRREPIIGQWERDSLPETQYRSWTSPSLIEIAEAMPDWAPAAMRSPLRLEAWLRGYFGGLAQVGWQGSDRIVRSMGGFSDAPAKPLFEEIFARFYREGAPNSTKWVEELYRMTAEADSTQSAISQYVRQGRHEQAKELMARRGAQVLARPRLNDLAKQMREVNETSRQVRYSKVPAKTKQEMLERLAKRRNDIARQVAPYADAF